MLWFDYTEGHNYKDDLRGRGRVEFVLFLLMCMKLIERIESAELLMKNIILLLLLLVLLFLLLLHVVDIIWSFGFFSVAIVVVVVVHGTKLQD